ncbi:caspase domain-containing protein [Hysterangium stoloniferum]|nr:caspase domain-containing protein [Hysterangium stoloniferum]
MKIEFPRSPNKVEGFSGPNRTALCIGIKSNINPNKSLLEQVLGAHNDAKEMAEWLRRKGFEVNTMLDDLQGPLPTRNNIQWSSQQTAIQNLTADAQRGDVFFFSYSGHGTQIDNEDGKELDHLDEVILPYDATVKPGAAQHDRNRWDRDTIIINNELYDWLVKPLPSGTYLTVLLDTCCSGTAMDLKYFRKVDDNASKDYSGISDSSTVPSIIPGRNGEAIPHRTRRSPGVIRSFSLDHSNLQQEPKDGPTVSAYNRNIKHCWSACPDSQRAYGSKSGGLLTQSWLDCFDKPHPTKLTLRAAVSEMDRILEVREERINNGRSRRSRAPLKIHNAQVNISPYQSLSYRRPSFLKEHVTCASYGTIHVIVEASSNGLHVCMSAHNNYPKGHNRNSQTTPPREPHFLFTCFGAWGSPEFRLVIILWSGHGAQIKPEKQTGKDNLDERNACLVGEFSIPKPWGSKLTVELDGYSFVTTTDPNSIIDCKRKTSQDTIVNQCVRKAKEPSVEGTNPPGFKSATTGRGYSYLFNMDGL